MNLDDPEAIHDLILDRLAAHVRPNDIVMEVVQLTGLDWAEAAHLVSQVQSERGAEVNQRQFPLLLALGLVSALTGFGLVLDGLYKLSAFVAAYLPGGLAPLEVAGVIYSGMGVTFYFIGQVLIGLATLIGTYVGLRNTWALALEKVLSKF